MAAYGMSGTADQEERFKWQANDRADRAESELAGCRAERDALSGDYEALVAEAARPAPDSALREARTEGYREGRLSVWLEIQEAANDGVKLARRIAKELDHAD